MNAEGLEEDSQVAVGPSVMVAGGAEVQEEVKLEDAWDHKVFRSKGATLNYLGQDRSDIQYAVKTICQGMSTPTEGGNARIKITVRLVWRYWYGEKEADDEVVVVDVFIDSDWASAAERKSTSGGMMCVDGVGVKHWSRTQKARALSSGKAE